MDAVAHDAFVPHISWSSRAPRAGRPGFFCAPARRFWRPPGLVSAFSGPCCTGGLLARQRADVIY
eukprot:2320393-Pyramimonas_sp.AAC.1